ncbi:MAG: putative membrane protein [Planctomycetota bacterium]|jgi:uncharacterized membrane protein
MIILFAVLGFLIGTVLDGPEVGLVGALLSCIPAALIQAHRRLGWHEKRLATQEREIKALRSELDEQRAQQESRVSSEVSSASVPDAKQTPAEFNLEARDSAVRVAAALSSPLPPPLPKRHMPLPRPPGEAPKPKRKAGWEAGIFGSAGAWTKELFTGGNTMVRAGLLVLLVGVVLLLKYAAEHSLFPIEARMGSAALLGSALIAVGFRKIESRPGFATTLQGGGVAILYMVVFFSFAKYELLPAVLAFGLLASIAMFSGAMAVLQNSLAMILIGITFGFLAPLLANTGSGNHVALFGYYTVLNLLIVGVAWYRSWRPLNLLGFCFTFGIGTVWGVLDYKPENFASTEPFLIGFFLMYVAIVAIFAWRRPAKLKGWVDGSLTFGAPLAVLALQYQLVKDMPFGMAYTAAGMAAVYIIVASFLFQRAPKAMRNLVEAFLALGVGFATLAIPYGFSNQSLTGATWAVEGLGLYWLGVRQQRPLSRIAGGALQLLAGVALLGSLLWNSYPDEALPVLNTRFVAGLFLAFCGYAIAYLAHRHRDKLPKAERFFVVLIPWSVIWWFGISSAEINEHVPRGFEPAAGVLWFASTCLLYELLGRRLRWTQGRIPALLAVPGIFLLTVSYGMQEVALNPSAGNRYNGLAFELTLRRNPLADGGWLAWPVLVASLYFILFRMSRDKIARLVPLHAAGHWSVTLLVALLVGYFVRSVDGLTGSWSVAAFGCALLGMFALTWRLLGRIQDDQLRASYGKYLLGVMALALCVWHMRTGIMASGEGGALIGYLPLINPIDVSLGLVFVTLWAWLQSNRRDLLPVLGPMAFLWFSGTLARTAFHLHEATFADVTIRTFRYDLQSLWNLGSLQVAYSVSWALIGLATILWATKRSNRVLWQVGSGLLGVVVIKLFLVDLKELGSIQKIVTFLVVGLLLLVVGYFSPMPPSPAKSKAETESELS